MTDEEKQLFQLLLEKLDSLDKRIEKMQDTILDALLEEYKKLKPDGQDAFANLLKNFRNKSS